MVVEDAGRAWPTNRAAAGWRPGLLEEGLLPISAELHRGVLTSGAADQLAALVARAAHAPVGLIHFLQGGRLRLYGGWGVAGSWDEIADTPIDNSLTGLVLHNDDPVVISDLAADERGPVWVPRGTARISVIRYATSRVPCSASAAPPTPNRGSGPSTRSPRSPRPPRCAPC
ncbi:hypothetical protein [Paractinoplanes durhamensis]|uniref:hypothetical protein n=1 Tax=Paractinoplanes durhamensis TaxID=113563 RepID=UPI0036283A2F